MSVQKLLRQDLVVDLDFIIGLVLIVGINQMWQQFFFNASR